MKLVISDNERELDVLSDPDIRLLQDGLEMPLVARELTYAESADSDGRRRIRSKNQNAEGRIGLHISGTSDSHFWDKVDNVQELVESAHRNKGSIVYEPPGGTAVAYDIESITVTGLPQQGIELRNRRQNAEITFEVQPYGRLTPVELVSGGTLDGPIDYVTVENVPGQVMAFGDLTLTDASTQNRNFLEVGVQNDFDPTNPEPIFLTAGSMADAGGTLTALGGVNAGTASRPADAYTTSGGNSYTLRATLSTTPTAIATTSERGHKGLWKIRARVQAEDANVRVRLAWRLGTGAWNREGWKTVPLEDAWADIDLGTVNIPTLEGTHAFEARIEAASSTGYPDFDLDTVSLIPADRYLRLRGRTISETTSALLAADDFNSHSAGTLTGKTPPVTAGGNWTGSGDTTDFDVVAGGVVQRSAVLDSADTGRWAQAGTAVATAVDVRCDLNLFTGTYRAGIFARYVDTNNFVMAQAQSSNLGGLDFFFWFILKRVAGTITVLTGKGLSAAPGNTRAALIVLSDGSVYLNTGPANSESLTNFLYYAGDADLQAGGALDDGTYGIYHENLSAIPQSVTFDNFTVTTPTGQQTLLPVVASGQAVEIDHQSADTASSDGSYFAPTPVREGNYLYLPPGTRNSEKSRIVVRSRREDIDGGFDDTGLTDDLTASLSVTPRVTLK